MIRSQLVEAGFHAAPLAEAASVFLAGANLYYNIEVLSDEAETALRFLADVGYGDLLVRPAG